MRILYVITQGTWGGAQAHLFSLIQEQVRLNNQVWLVVGKSGRLTRDVIKTCPEVKVIILKHLVRQIALKKDLQVIWKLRNYIKQIQPDIIHLHSTKAGLIGRLAAVRNRVKVLYTIHGWAFTPGVNVLQRYLTLIMEKILVPFTDKYICVSQFDYDLGINNRIINDKHSGIVIHNGVTEWTGNNSVVTTNMLTMAARFDRQKRQDLLIRALADVKNPSVKLCLLGDGPLLANCKILAKKLGIASRVTFVGSVRNVQRYYANSTVGVLVSDYEGLPVSLVEAMAQGLPILASNVGGNSELVDHNGYLVTNDPTEIAHWIDELIDNTNELDLMGRKSRQIFERDFTEDAMLYQTDVLYKQLLNDRKS